MTSLASQPRFEDLMLCVADYSTRPVREHLPATFLVRGNYLHLPLDPPFNRSFALNYAYQSFRAGRGDYFLMSDIDFVFPAGFIGRCFDHIAAGHLCVAGVCHYLDAAPSRRLLASEEVPAEKPDVWRVHRGGFGLVASSLFDEIGGFDEAFEGWGGEDDDFFDRVDAAGHYFADPDLQLLHLDHPSREDLEASYREENRRRLERKRRSEIRWRDWRNWGEPAQHTAIDREIPRFMRPVRANGFQLAVGDGGRLVVSNKERAHPVNRPAAAVFSLCGGRTVGGITDYLSRRTGEPQERLRVDVPAAVAALAALGALSLVAE